MKQSGWLAGLLLFHSLAFAQQAAEPTADAVKSLNPSPIGYESVQDAFEALNADPSASQSIFQGWTIFNR